MLHQRSQEHKFYSLRRSFDQFFIGQMASAKRISSFIVDQLSGVARRGFATGRQGSVYGGVKVSGGAMMKKAAGEESKKSSSWIPDPITGYYKPEGQINPVDATELRELPLKLKNRRN
ncbi:putative Late embryogenesis abundant protein, LEA_3 subgroup [Helianthus annuus]|nr:putative Late embryogenesis abundant protein, LEA_3 subgroup [Helianthus annuus]